MISKAVLLNSLVAVVGCVLVVAHQVAMHWRGRAEQHIGAQVVAAGLAEIAVAAGHARLDSHTVSYLNILHFGASLEINVLDKKLKTSRSFKKYKLYS